MHRANHVLGCDEPRQFGILIDQPPAGQRRQQKDRHHRRQSSAQGAHAQRNGGAEQLRDLIAPATRRAIQQRAAGRQQGLEPQREIGAGTQHAARQADIGGESGMGSCDGDDLGAVTRTALAAALDPRRQAMPARFAPEQPAL